MRVIPVIAHGSMLAYTRVKHLECRARGEVRKDQMKEGGWKGMKELILDQDESSLYSLPYWPACGELREIKLRTQWSGKACRMDLDISPPWE